MVTTLLALDALLSLRERELGVRESGIRIC
jgi:hypothetical protein